MKRLQHPLFRLFATLVAAAVTAALSQAPGQLAAAPVNTRSIAKMGDEGVAGTDVKRVAAEVGGAVIGLAAGTLFTALVFVTMFAGDHGFDGLRGFVAPILGVLGTVTLVSLGIYLGGELAGGDSNFWWTSLGVYAGAALALVISLVTEVDGVIGVVVTVVASIVGGIVMYELFNEDGATEASRTDALFLAPRPDDGAFVVAVPGGAVAGFAVSF